MYKIRVYANEKLEYECEIVELRNYLNISQSLIKFVSSELMTELCVGKVFIIMNKDETIIKVEENKHEQ